MNISNRPSPSAFRLIIWFTIVYCLGFAVCIVLLTLADAWFLGIGGIGIAWSTAQLTAVWAGLGPGPYWRRALSSFTTGVFVAGGGTLGYLLVASTGYFITINDALTSLIACAWMGPFLWLVGQAPLLPLRYALGWNIGKADRNASTDPCVRLTIADLMLFTAISAICFGGFQLARGLLSEPSLQFDDFVPLAGFLTAVSLATMLLFTIPAVLLTLSPQRTSGGAAIAVLTSVLACFAFLILAALHAAVAFPFLIMLLFGGAFFLGLPLCFLREAGYVLHVRSTNSMTELGKDAQRQTTTGTDPTVAGEAVNGSPNPVDSNFTGMRHPLDES